MKKGRKIKRRCYVVLKSAFACKLKIKKCRYPPTSQKIKTFMSDFKRTKKPQKNRVIKTNLFKGGKMSLAHLTDKTLLSDTIDYAKREKFYSAKVIECIAEVRKRRAFVQLGYASLFEFCLKELKFSEAQAMRRIDAAKLLLELPEIQEKLEKGKINLTQLNLLRPLFKGKKHSAVEKKKVIEEIQGASTRKVQQMVALELGDVKAASEKLKVINSTQSELTLVVDEEFLAMLKELKERMIHEGVKDFSTMVKKICGKELEERKEKFQLKSKAAKAATTVGPKLGPAARAIPRAMKREVWQRAKGKCEYVSPLSPSAPTVICGSAFGLEFHHKTPFALVQEHEAQNLQLLCQDHHGRQSYLYFGSRKP